MDEKSASNPFFQSLAETLQGEPSSIEEARQILMQIRSEKGYLNPETLQDLGRLSATSRQEIEKALESLREQASAYTKSIAEQLYSSKFRFIYELIQNADDAYYSRVTSGHEAPRLSFDLSPERLRVDTNEDGFTRNNVEAICATGKSSKKATEIDNHIGEKGFGFKSVFAIANKAMVQSGVWSFYFEYNEGDDGLGMVTPKDAPHETLDPNVTTRITLHFTEEQRESFAKLTEEIENMPDATILYLQNIKKLTIRVTDLQGNVSCTNIEYHKESPRQASLVRSTEHADAANNTTVNKTSKLYRTFERKLCDMPKDRRRPYGRDPYVRLAFPVDTSSGKPAIDERGEYVFAYLPLYRSLQMKFLIQSDFITSASRESIVDCPWNEKLRKGIVETFCDAIIRFCDDPVLVYEWLKFLPEMPMEGYWKTLYSETVSLLEDRPILQSWETRSLKTPSQLKIVPKSFIYKGLPLLADLKEEIYLAPEYSIDDEELLSDLGVTTIGWNGIFCRIDSDLASGTSRIKKTPPGDPWHDQMATKLLRAYNKPLPRNWIQQEIEQRSLIPLGETWVSATDLRREPAYFPYTEDIPIPTDIALRLVEPKAAASSKRRELFRTFGVRECQPAHVIERIIDRHKLGAFSVIREVVCHFVYIHCFSSDAEIVKKHRLGLVTTDPLVLIGGQGIYFKSDAEYDTEDLLKPLSYTEMSSAGLAYFIHDAYITAQIPGGPRHGRSWMQWLQEVAGIRYYPKLVSNTGFDLSLVLRHVLENSPRKFVGALKTHWSSSYRVEFENTPGLRLTLGVSRVPCENGELAKLEETYLPRPEIISKADEFGLANHLPVITLPKALDSANYHEWQFLEVLGVRSTTDLKFLLLALSAIKKLSISITGNTGSATELQIFALLKEIGNMCSQKDVDHLRKFFDENAMIYVPSRPTSDRWKRPVDCVWHAPSFLTVRDPLDVHYARDTGLTTVFRIFLQVRDANYKDYIQELQHLQDLKEGNEDRTSQIYQELLNTVKIEEEWNDVKKSFEEDDLVFAQGYWFPPSECLWTSTISIYGTVTIGHIYNTLKPFFVTRLKVKTADVEMAILELTRKAKARKPSSIAAMKDIILKIGSMLREEPAEKGLSDRIEALKKCNFLPVRVNGGESSLQSVTTEFALVDHHRYADGFRTLASMLDFSFNETQDLHRFIELLGLEDRYLSRNVKECSEVDSEAALSEPLSQDLTERAYALYCCAVRFGSTKVLSQDDSLFRLLRSIKVFTTDNISSNLLLAQNGRVLKVESERKQLLVTEGDPLKLHVPHNRQDQYICFRSQLPEAMLNILGIANRAATHTVGLVLGTDLDIIDVMLKERDVAPVPWIDKPEPKQPTYEVHTPVKKPFSGVNYGLLTPETPQTPNTVPSYTPYPAFPELQQAPFPPAENHCFGHPASFAAARSSPPKTSRQTDNYRMLLDQILNVACGIDNLSKGPNAWDFGKIWQALPRPFDTDDVFGVRALGQFAHDSKIGAAGELYVFERLLKLNFLNFARENWRSSIRKEVTVHPKYADMAFWTGQETADIVYVDRNGEFTDFLREHYSGNFPEWPENTNGLFTPIEYFVEVKTTTQTCDNRFFMSKYQYKRMCNMQVRAGERPSQVYVIVRVFDLMSENVDMRIFVDPWRLRDGTLKFEATEWTVTPNTMLGCV